MRKLGHTAKPWRQWRVSASGIAPLPWHSHSQHMCNARCDRVLAQWDFAYYLCMAEGRNKMLRSCPYLWQMCVFIASTVPLLLDAAWGRSGESVVLQMLLDSKSHQPQPAWPPMTTSLFVRLCGHVHDFLFMLQASHMTGNGWKEFNVRRKIIHDVSGQAGLVAQFQGKKQVPTTQHHPIFQVERDVPSSLFSEEEVVTAALYLSKWRNVLHLSEAIRNKTLHLLAKEQVKRKIFFIANSQSSKVGVQEHLEDAISPTLAYGFNGIQNIMNKPIHTIVSLCYRQQRKPRQSLYKKNVSDRSIYQQRKLVHSLSTSSCNQHPFLFSIIIGYFNYVFTFLPRDRRATGDKKENPSNLGLKNKYYLYMSGKEKKGEHESAFKGMSARRSQSSFWSPVHTVNLRCQK